MNPHLHTSTLIFMVILLSSSPSLKVVDAAVPPTIAKPGCLDRCGDVSIPFPFGIGHNCFLDSWFEIRCNTSADSTKALLSKFNIEVTEITLPEKNNEYLQSVIVSLPSLNKCIGDKQGFAAGINFTGSPYTISTSGNVFITKGCAGSAALINENNGVMVACGTVCRNKNNSAIFTNQCNGVECCQMPLPSESSNGNASPLQFYRIGFYGQSSVEDQNCLRASLIMSGSVNQYIGKLSTSSPSTLPVLLYWSLMSTHWPHSNPRVHCGTNDCKCEGSSVGNPYLFNGCKVPQSCKKCHTYCSWDAGTSSYICYDDDSIIIIVAVMVIVVLCFVTVPILIVLGCCGLYRCIKRRRKGNRRVKFFKLKLKQHRSSNEGVVERTKLFTHKQLTKATDHFNESRVLGKGGQGTVYKGMLTDGKIVAIKTSKLTDESQLEQFVNEAVVLSHINHRNVVKLLGCCLEKQVPLLVYEFISNGTLSKHLHDPDEDFVLSWPIRLKIAADSAGAIAYLHSSSSTPIYHRDIKPSNILLDDKYRAKVSDFGSSKTFEIEQTHLTTLVQGTFGYLDPEYFETNMFTEKSDVYSFGVVLLELLTSKKPIYRTETMEQKSLVVDFFLLREKSRLFNILDPKVVKEAKEEELMATIILAKHCLNGSGRLRPTMKEVAMRLEMIIKSRDETSSFTRQSFLNQSFSGFVTAEMEMSITSPAETSSFTRESFPNQSFSEFVTAEMEMSDPGFMSSPVPTSVASPLCIDVHPLLHNTI